MKLLSRGNRLLRLFSSRNQSLRSARHLGAVDEISDSPIANFAANSNQWDDANLGDLQQHARDFLERTGFTYTVLRPGTGETIGCVYIYPADDGRHDAHVRSWVRADCAGLDGPLYIAVTRWLAERWPFQRVLYAERAA